MGKNHENKIAVWIIIYWKIICEIIKEAIDENTF